MAMRVMIFGNKMVTRRLSTALAGEGIKVVSASDGLDGMMALLKQDEFDLAVVDSSVEGSETVCHNIKQLWGIPVVLMVKGKQTDWEKLQSLDSDAYIPEGIGAAELAARLRAVVRRRSQ